jgi:hypothetical protein
VRVAGGAQFIAGSMFQRQQGVTAAGSACRISSSLQDLVEIVLGDCFLACLRVLDHEDHGQGEGRGETLKDARWLSPSAREPDGTVQTRFRE